MKIAAPAGAATRLLLALPGSASPPSPQLLDAWVSFTDKGIPTDEERRTQLRTLEASFDPRALARRRLRRTLPGLSTITTSPCRSATWRA